MAAPLVRQKQPQPSQLESATRIKRAEDQSELEERSALNPSPPTREVRMKIPRGMPVLPGGRRMPPLPVRLRESLEPLRRSLAPLRRSLAPLLGIPATPPSTERVSDASPAFKPRRWPLLVALVLLLAVGAAAAWWFLGRPR